MHDNCCHSCFSPRGALMATVMDRRRSLLMRHGRSKVGLPCQNIFRSGVASEEVSLDHAFHICAWLGYTTRCSSVAVAPKTGAKRNNDKAPEITNRKHCTCDPCSNIRSRRPPCPTKPPEKHTREKDGQATNRLSRSVLWFCHTRSAVNETAGTMT